MVENKIARDEVVKDLKNKRYSQCEIIEVLSHWWYIIEE
jgi:hypothetical protein